MNYIQSLGIAFAIFIVFLPITILAEQSGSTIVFIFCLIICGSAALYLIAPAFIYFISN